MGNSASALPYAIQAEVYPSSRDGSNGWAIHAGARKSDGAKVSVFKASKPTLLKTPLTPPVYGGGGSSSSGAASKFFGGSTTVGKTKVDPNSQFFPAMHHFRKIKTLVHPHLIKVYATLDTDVPAEATGGGTGASSSSGSSSGMGSSSGTIGTTGDLVIVTEEVIPLTTWLDGLDLTNNGNADKHADSIAWGLYCVIQALHFLHNNAKMSHSAVCPDSIFVTPGGDFKLGNYSLTLPAGDANSPQLADEVEYFQRYEALMCPSAYRSPERVNGEHDFILRSLPPHVMDSYSLGVFIETLYSRCGRSGAVPDKLVKAVARLKTPSATQRPRVGPLVRCPIFNAPLVKSMDFLGEIAVKPAEEKVAYFQSLPDQLQRNVLPPGAAEHKLLPALIQSLGAITGNPQAMMQDVLRREVMAIIPPLFMAAELLDDASFQKDISPIIATLFQLNDRGVRGAILSRLPAVTPRLDQASVNACVFEPMCSGFTDSSGALRELTLKSTLPLIPSLSVTNLDKLVRYLVRLQGDQEPSIRTNTVIFITKISPSLTDTSRSKLILPAFTRAMKDPFTPCRLAALKSIMQCKEYFDHVAIATKVLPCVVPHLMDGTAAVRDEAFAVLEHFTASLREESRKMAEREAEQAAQRAADGGQSPSSGGLPSNGMNGGTMPVPTHHQQQPPPAAPASGGSAASSSYLSGLTSWAASAAASAITSQTKSDGGGAAAPAAPPPPSQQQPQQTPYSLPPAPAQPQQSAPYQFGNSGTGANANVNAIGATTQSVDDDMGWSDDDDDVAKDGGGGDAKDGFEDSDFFKVSNQKSEPILGSPPSWAKPTVEESDVDDFFSSNMVGGMKIGGVGKTGFGSKPSLSATSSSSAAGGAGRSKLIVPNKKKQSLAERKAEFAKRKAEREKQQGAGNKAIGAKKLANSGTDNIWDDF